MITIEQRPIKLTPTNTNHVYTMSSPNSGNTDFRYVLDLYVDSLTGTGEKITRLLVSPNTYGKGIVDVQRIVQNYVEGNVRSEQPQYTSETTTGNTPYSLITNTKGISPSNAFNGNSNYPKRVHVRDYRVMVGEQYSTAGVVNTYISTQPEIPGSTMYGTVESGRPTWWGAGCNIPEGSSYQKGVNWYYQGTSGTSTNEDGNILPVTPTPVEGYTVEIIEKYSGIQLDYEYAGGQWYFIGYTYPAGGSYLPYYSPPAVIIWPGTTLEQGSKIAPLINNYYWDETDPLKQQEYWEVKRYLMSGITVNDEQPSLFLTTAGESKYYAKGITGGLETNRARRRKHHPSCPIVVSWFQGLLGSDPYFEFNNALGCFSWITGTTQQSEYGDIVNEVDIRSYITTGITSQDNRILYYNTIRPDLAGGKIGFYTAGDVGDYEYNGYAYSELLEFYLEDDNCLSDPVHVVFLNRQGVWDTYTLDRKALETKSISKKTYDKSTNTNTNIYSLLSSERRTVVYDQDITEVMNVSTWYLEDNDKQIVEDLFMSPEIYIIKDHDWTGKTEKSYNPYLLPVTLRTNSITEFKNRYNKLAKYTFNLEYTPINEYNTQG